jgi:hypothetical protein
MQHLYQRLCAIALRLGRFRNSALVTATAAGMLIGGSTTGIAQSPPPGIPDGFEAPIDPAFAAEPVWQAPPPLRTEVIPLVRRPGWTWSPGYWRWIGRSYVWIEGRWLPLRSGFHYVPAHWERVGGAWLFVPARWAHRSALVAP